MKRHETPFVKKAAMKATGELLSRPAAYRAAIAAADVALAHLPRFVIYNGLNAWGKHREVPHQGIRLNGSLGKEGGEGGFVPCGDFAAHTQGVPAFSGS